MWSKVSCLGKQDNNTEINLALNTQRMASKIWHWQVGVMTLGFSYLLLTVPNPSFGSYSHMLFIAYEAILHHSEVLSIFSHCSLSHKMLFPALWWKLPFPVNNKKKGIPFVVVLWMNYLSIVATRTCQSTGWVYCSSNSFLGIVILPNLIPLRRRLFFFVWFLSIVNTVNRESSTSLLSLDLVMSISSPSFTYRIRKRNILD